MDQPSFSTDGRTLLFSAGFRSVNPAAIPFDPVALRAAEPQVILHRTGLLYPGSVSPNGARLALFNPGERQPDLFVMQRDGSDLRRLTDDDARDVEPQWSPDGTFLTFQSNRGGRYATWSIRPDGSGLSALVERRNSDVTDMALSPADGRAVFSANLGSYFARPPFPAPEDRHEQIPNLTVPAGRLIPRHWSPDGRYLSAHVVTMSGTPVGVAVYDVIAQQPRMLTQDPWIFSPVFLPDSRRLAYFTFASELVVVDITSGTRRVIPTTLPFRVAPGALAMATDGRTLYVGAERTEANVWKVEVDATR
jgi:Tol biopolymer transport system component